MTDREKARCLEMLEANGASPSLIKEMQQMWDDEAASDDLEPRGGELSPRNPVNIAQDGALRAEDMNTVDAYKKMRAYSTAQAMVRPFCGEVLGADSADVLRKAISKLGWGELLSSGLPRAALPEVWRIVARNIRGGSARPRLAMDTKRAKSFAERFPDVARIRVDTFGDR